MYIDKQHMTLATTLLLTQILLACSSSSSSTTATDDAASGDLLDDEVMIDATAGGRSAAADNPYTYFNLLTGAVVDGLTDAQAESSMDWHIAFKRTNPIKLNGGVSGPADVAGAMAVESDMYDGAGDINDAVYPSMTKLTEADHFDELVQADVTGLSYEYDTHGQAIASTDWAVYDSMSHTYDLTGNWWIVRSGEGNSYAKVSITDYTAPNITVQYYLQGAGDSTYSSTPQSFTTSLAGDGSVCIDLDTGTAVTGCDIDNADSSTWDLLWERDSATHTRNIWTNGGIVGTGDGGAIGPNDELSDYDNYLSGGEYTSPTTGDVFIISFNEDSSGGVFSNQTIGAKYGWAEYDLGDNNKMWPNYRVWAIRIGDGGSYRYYRLQVTNYYNEGGESGHISFRFSEIQ